LKALAGSGRFDKVFLIHRTIRPRLRDKLKGKPGIGSPVKDVYFATLLPDREIFYSINRWLNRLQIFRQTRCRSRSVDLLFAYWPKGYLAWKATGLRGILLFDTDHHLIDDPHLDDEQRLSRKSLFNLIFEDSDWIISSARSMLLWIRGHGFSRIERVRNGVDLSRFNGIKQGNKASGKSPVIGYLGTLSHWIDWELLLMLVERNPSCLFQFIGKPFKSLEYKKLLGMPNVEFYGHQTPEEVVQSLKGFDVGLVLYRKHPGLDVDSMKIYEYLAAGVPVVSTRFHDHLKEDFNGLLYLGDRVDELERGISRALRAGNYREYERQEFLERCDWSKRAEEIIQLCTGGGEGALA